MSRLLQHLRSSVSGRAGDGSQYFAWRNVLRNPKVGDDEVVRVWTYAVDVPDEYGSREEAETKDEQDEILRFQISMDDAVLV